MTARLDHLIVGTNDIEESIGFYRDVLGFAVAGTQGPFTVLAINDDSSMLLAPGGTRGGMHLAFNFDQATFATVIDRIQTAELPFGDRFDAVDNGRGPSPQPGSRGDEMAIYLFDPNAHLIEVRADA